MAAINSPSNPNNFPEIPGPGPATYVHGVDSRQTFIPMAFQITSPLNNTVALLPHALVMHVNPQNLSESYTKKKEVIQTRGGWVEQHWGDELTEISADGSTGAFMNIYTGLTSLLRQQTIAWDRYRDLLDLFRNNGSLYDPFGAVVLQGSVMLMYDRGTFVGYFKSFDVEETDDTPFMFKISWTFKVQQTYQLIPVGTAVSPNGAIATPSFQSTNFQGTPSANPVTSGGTSAPSPAVGAASV